MNRPLLHRDMRTLALWHHARVMDATIPHMKGFAEHYYKSITHHREKALIDQFEEVRAATADEMLKIHEEDES